MSFSGEVTIHNDQLLSGWCIRSDKPEELTSVAVYFEEIFLKSVVANLPCPEAESMFGTNHGCFWLALDAGLIALLPKNSRLRVETSNGEILPERLTDLVSPVGGSMDKGKKLRRLLAKGYTLDKWGGLKQPFAIQSKKDKSEWLDSLSAVSVYFKENFDLTIFPHYGTLLGYAKGKTFLRHDDDVDVSYYLQEASVKKVSNHFYECASHLIRSGHECHVLATGQMHVKMRGQKRIIDVFTSWQNQKNVFSSYFAVSGKLSSQLTFFEDHFEGLSVNIPVQFKEILTLTYGPKWNIPDPYFHFTPSDEVGKLMKSLEAFGSKRLLELRALTS